MYEHYEEGQKTLSFLINFLKDRIEAEEKHGSKLQKQATKSSGWTEAGCVSFDSLLSFSLLPHTHLPIRSSISGAHRG